MLNAKIEITVQLVEMKYICYMVTSNATIVAMVEGQMAVYKWSLTTAKKENPDKKLALANSFSYFPYSYIK